MRKKQRQARRGFAPFRFSRRTLLSIACLAVIGGLLYLKDNVSRNKDAPAPSRHGGLLAGNIEGRVIEVPDGDSIVVRQADGSIFRVRLYGVDSPELHQKGGTDAADFTRGLLLSKHVSLAVVDKDQYGRVVAVVRASNGDIINEELVRAGHAWVYRSLCHEAMCSSWLDMERHAKKQSIGLWRQRSPMPPWKWRRTNPRR